MLNMPRKTLLALEAVLYVAYNARPNPVQARDITERQGIPQRYLEQVLQHLVRRAILKGVRGPRGGYTLARERRRMTLGEVVRVLDEIDHEDNLPASGAELSEKVIAPIWDEIRTDMLRRLDAITLEDLCARASTIGIPRAGPDNIDFVI